MDGIGKDSMGEFNMEEEGKGMGMKPQVWYNWAFIQ